MVRFGDVFDHSGNHVCSASDKEIGALWEQAAFDFSRGDIIMGTSAEKHDDALNQSGAKRREIWKNAVVYLNRTDMATTDNLFRVLSDIDEFRRESLRWESEQEFFDTLALYTDELSLLLDDVRDAVHYTRVCLGGKDSYLSGMDSRVADRYRLLHSYLTQSEIEDCYACILSDQKYSLPFSENDIQQGCCDYFFRVLLLDDFQRKCSESLNFLKSLFHYSVTKKDFWGNCRLQSFSKYRTFPYIFKCIQPLNSTPPLREDMWYFEKITGISAVLSLNEFVGEDCISRSETLRIANSFLRVIMECKPVRVRTALADIVAKALGELQSHIFLDDKRKTEVYDLDKISVWEEKLSSTVHTINKNYSMLVKKLYLDVTESRVNGYTIFSKIYEDDQDKIQSCTPGPISDNQARQLACSMIYNSHGLDYAIRTSNAHPEKRRLSANDPASRYASLQTTAIVSALYQYGFDIKENRFE